ncbi:unnamed protein product [Paramecium pentaurelia]|uniref:Transmembrane protein n=1 Tax=Paramecium pentaurelia TaxID=43138 RepID=A0A8S1V3P9_9CILI|nr:unnamed protein product [Paramecium pentaurelia]
MLLFNFVLLLNFLYSIKVNFGKSSQELNYCVIFIDNNHSNIQFTTYITHFNAFFQQVNENNNPKIFGENNQNNPQLQIKQNQSFSHILIPTLILKINKLPFKHKSIGFVANYSYSYLKLIQKKRYHILKISSKK